MRTLTTLVLLALAVTLAPAAPPVDLKGKTLAQTFDDLLPKLGEQAAQQKWQDVCFQAGAPANEAMRAEACKLMHGKLDVTTPAPVRVFLLLQLERLGRDESVGPVAAQLDDKDGVVRDAAVRALTRNPAPAATAKLGEKVAGATGIARIALLNALGSRGDKAAVETVAKDLTAKDEAVAIAAARALGRIRGAEAAHALDAVRGKVDGKVRLAVLDAILAHTDRLFQAGRPAEARAVYEELSKLTEAAPIRLAALNGLLLASGDDAGALVLKLLAGDDKAGQAIAVARIETLSAGALKTLAAEMDKLPPAGRVLVLTGLAARGEKSQLPAVVAALKSPDAAVQRAAVRAVGRLGDASVVSPLLDLAFAGGATGGDAVESLVALADDGATAKLVALLDAEKTPARFAKLVEVVERRKATAAVPALLKAAEDAALRGAALAGLRTLAEAKHAPQLVAVLLKTEKGKDRDAAEDAVVAAAGTTADAVLVAYEAGDKGQKVALLPVLGRLGGAKALALLRAARDADAEASAAAIQGLLRWPDATASDDLLRLAELAKEPAQRKQAIAALVRVNGVVTDYPAAERLATLKKAMALAPGLDERRQVLAGIGFVRHLESLRYALPYLDDKDLAAAAQKAVVELAHSRMLREPNRAEFDKALDRVIKECTDKMLVERAKGYRQAP